MSDNLIVKTNYRTLRAIYNTKTRLNKELLEWGGGENLYVTSQNSDVWSIQIPKQYRSAFQVGLF